MPASPRKPACRPRSSRRCAPARRPPFTRDVERIVYDFVTEYLETNRVSAPNYKRAVDAFGEQGVVDLVGVCGYYMLVSMTLNVFEMPLPPGEPDPIA